jgi:hypothetical protein
LHANLSKWVQQIWNLTDAGRQTWVADECQSWQRHSDFGVKLSNI